MYLTKGQELERNVLRLGLLIVIGLVLFTLIAVLFSIPFGVFGYRPTWLIMSLTLGVIYFYINWILGKVIRVVDGNTRLLMHNPMWRRDLPEIVGDKGKQTDPNEYGPGLHFIWPWEEEIETVSLKADISEEFTQTLSSIDDDVPTVEIQFDVEPDPLRCAYYILNGEDEADRKKNIRERLRALIRGELEAFFGGKVLPGQEPEHSITIDELFRNLKKIRGKLSTHFHRENSSLQKECHIMGVRLKRVRVGDINRSDDNSKAIRVGASTKKYEEAAQSLVDNLGVSPETALAGALSIGDEAEVKGIIIGTSDKAIEGIAKAVEGITAAFKK